MKPIFALALLALPAFAAFPNGYSYCKVVTTSVSMVSGTSDLTNYPLTVILTDADLKTTANGGMVNNANGYDIGFYPDCSGSGTALEWEMESYSPTTGAIVAHVLRPTLSHTTNDTIGMYYGGSFSSFQSTASAVWDANYKGVWHLGNVPTSATDSTTNARAATTLTATSATGGDRECCCVRWDRKPQVVLCELVGFQLHYPELYGGVLGETGRIERSPCRSGTVEGFRVVCLPGIEWRDKFKPEWRRR
jgi:hypothetical protein